MPEIGYWKYVRFNDDEPLYFGTDDDVTIVFDSADDRLEYRMKKDIRFEDDAGNEILTLDKTNRYVKLGTHLKTAGYRIIQGISDDSYLFLRGGSTLYTSNGAGIDMYGAAYTGAEGLLSLSAAEINNTNARVRIVTADTTPALRVRILVNQGDTPDVDFINCNVDLNNNLLKNTKLGTDFNANEKALLNPRCIELLYSGLTPYIDFKNDPTIDYMSRFILTAGTTLEDGVLEYKGKELKVTAGDFVTRVEAGAPTHSVSDGAIVIDTVNNRIWARVGGVWRYVALT